jgi:hypothetical protein
MLGAVCDLPANVKISILPFEGIAEGSHVTLTVSSYPEVQLDAKFLLCIWLSCGPSPISTMKCGHGAIEGNVTGSRVGIGILILILAGLSKFTNLPIELV